MSVMKVFYSTSLVVFAALAVGPGSAQSDRPTLLMHLQRSVQKQVSGVAVADVVLQGTATRAMGIATQTAQVTLTATANGNSTLVLSNAESTLRETTAVSPGLKRLRVWHATGTQERLGFDHQHHGCILQHLTGNHWCHAAHLPLSHRAVVHAVFALKAAISAQSGLEIARLANTPFPQDIGNPLCGTARAI